MKITFFKNQLLVFFLLGFAFFITSCATTPKVTTDVKDAYQSLDGLTFHNQAYMKKTYSDVTMPKGVNEKHFQKLPLGALPTFDQLTRSAKSSDVIPPKTFKQLKVDFESMLSSTNRFPVATIVEGRADKSLRENAAKGIVNAQALDTSTMVNGEYAVNVLVSYENLFSYQKGMRTETKTMSWTCTPVEVKNNAPIKWWPAATFSAKEVVVNKTSSTGSTIGGLTQHSEAEKEVFFRNLGKKNQLRFLNWIYTNFPAGGKVSEISIDDKSASVQANRSTGLLNNSQMVIYARKKGGKLPIPLFNATATSANEGDSTLTIWRSAQKPTAKKIIETLKKEGWDAVEADYDVWAVADGISEVPDFINL